MVHGGFPARLAGLPSCTGKPPGTTEVPSSFAGNRQAQLFPTVFQPPTAGACAAVADEQVAISATPGVSAGSDAEAPSLTDFTFARVGAECCCCCVGGDVFAAASSGSGGDSVGDSGHSGGGGDGGSSDSVGSSGSDSGGGDSSSNSSGSDSSGSSSCGSISAATAAGGPPVGGAP
ncbi:hypothetical protein MNEG_12212, partial [Monoraphidium neglectum]